MTSRRLLLLPLAVLAACTSAPPVAPLEPDAELEVKPPLPVEVDAEPPAPPFRLTIAAVGDMMIGTDYPENHLPDDDGIAFLAAVQPYLSSADIAFGNLEGVLVDGGEPGKKCSNPKACYLFRSPTRYAHLYRAAGFDLLSLANNHARDFGEEGRTSTMQALAATNIRHSGRVGDFASLEFDGKKVAMLAYAVTKNSNMLLDYALAERTIAKFGDTHDIVIVSFHGGAEGRDVTRIPFDDEEYYDEPRGDVVRFARMAVDAGADLVIGHGPHVVRAMERYDDRLIAYSLGNFATYYGISVNGIKGVAPILFATLDEDGAFVSGRIVSTVQQRPAGPSVDPDQQALDLVRSLSSSDFGTPGLEFLADGSVLPAERDEVERRAFDEGDPLSATVPCSDAWNHRVEQLTVTADGQGHGPDVGSGEWRSTVEFRLGIRDDPSVPGTGTAEWCAYVDKLIDK